MEKNSFDIIQSVFTKVRNQFIYVPDIEQFDKPEHWMSHADEVEAGEVFRDDCDGHALTCAELLIRAGIPTDRINLCFCTVETGTGHLVCVAYGWAMDNRQRFLWQWDQLPYTWIKAMCVGDPGPDKWKKILPVRRFEKCLNQL